MVTKKFYLKKTGKEVKMGDLILVDESTFKKGNLIITTAKAVKLSEETLPSLITRGIIGMTINKTTSVPMDLSYYIDKLAKKLGWPLERAADLLDTMDNVLPATAVSMLLREIAIELDKKYKDHIENSPRIFFISLFDGRIHEANKNQIKSYRNFAAFRTVEDARIACKIMRAYIKDLFKDERKQKDKECNQE